MKMIAEENKSGTIELLLTKAITDWEVILGKFLACLSLIIISLAFTLPYYISVWMMGPAMKPGPPSPDILTTNLMVTEQYNKKSSGGVFDVPFYRRVFSYNI